MILEKAPILVFTLALAPLLLLLLLALDGGVHDNATPAVFSVPWMILPQDRVVQSSRRWKTRSLNGGKANGDNKATNGFRKSLFILRSSPGLQTRVHELSCRSW